MKLLLTSAGIKNTSIHNALIGLLGKPIAEGNALCIPTSSYGHPMVSPVQAWKFISGQEPRTPMCELGWNSVGILELTALPSIDVMAARNSSRMIPDVADVPSTRIRRTMRR